MLGVLSSRRPILGVLLSQRSKLGVLFPHEPMNMSGQLSKNLQQGGKPDQEDASHPGLAKLSLIRLHLRGLVMTRDHKQRSGRLRKRTPEQIYHSKKNKHNTQATNHTITRAVYVVRQRCLRPQGGGKLHYESKNYYR